VYEKTGRCCCMSGIHPCKTSHRLNKKFPFKTGYFMGVRGLTASSYIVYVYTTSWHADL
jgi:hypothetical protein